ncbi:MAG: hypothetical protein C0391_09375 [Anaerolinea sp.]|nr:hypothetical protein [Anaerolinea sp.]
MTQALYRKWRPRLWGEVVGQDHIVQTLKNAIATDRVGHAYLFSGPRGTGKTTTARLLAKAVNCTGDDTEKPCDKCANCLAVKNGSFLDLIEIDAATNTGVDDVRDLKEKINFAPNVGKYKIYIIDEVHMFTQNAFNALLKTLEEPPAHAIFILATTDLHKVPPTILSRCQRFEFRRIPVHTVVELLRKNADADGIQVVDEVLTLIARQSTGSMRDAISLLDQLSSTNQEVTLDEAVTVLGTASHTAIADIVDAIIARDTGKGIDHLQHALDGGSEARQLARQMVDYLHNVLMIKSGSPKLVDATRETREIITRQAQQLQTRQVLTSLERFRLLVTDTRMTTWQPGLGFELALVETIEELAGTEMKAPIEPHNIMPTPTRGEEKTHISKQGAEKQARVEQPVMTIKETKASATDKVPVQPAKTEGVAEASASARQMTPPINGDAGEITVNWRKIAETVRKYNPASQALVNSCKPASVKNGCLYLAFASDALKAKMETNDHMENTRRAVKDVTGEDLQIRCIVAVISGGGEGKKDTPVTDGMVSTALRELGGQVVDVQDINETEEIQE